MNGNIRVICDNCKKKLRVEVNFPNNNKGFTTKVINCPHCNTELKIFDTHKYNENGTITN
jgi:formate dehydrogenase maturation protein FdhE